MDLQFTNQHVRSLEVAAPSWPQIKVKHTEKSKLFLYSSEKWGLMAKHCPQIAKTSRYGESQLTKEVTHKQEFPWKQSPAWVGKTEL